MAWIDLKMGLREEIAFKMPALKAFRRKFTDEQKTKGNICARFNLTFKIIISIHFTENHPLARRLSDAIWMNFPRYHQSYFFFNFVDTEIYLYSHGWDSFLTINFWNWCFQSDERWIGIICLIVTSSKWEVRTWLYERFSNNFIDEVNASMKWWRKYQEPT